MNFIILAGMRTPSSSLSCLCTKPLRHTHTHILPSFCQHLTYPNLIPCTILLQLMLGVICQRILRGTFAVGAYGGANTIGQTEGFIKASCSAGSELKTKLLTSRAHAQCTTEICRNSLIDLSGTSMSGYLISWMSGTSSSYPRGKLEVMRMPEAPVGWSLAF